jgi:hypothetical protein
VCVCPSSQSDIQCCGHRTWCHHLVLSPGKSRKIKPLTWMIRWHSDDKLAHQRPGGRAGWMVPAIYQTSTINQPRRYLEVAECQERVRSKEIWQVRAESEVGLGVAGGSAAGPAVQAGLGMPPPAPARLPAAVMPSVRVVSLIDKGFVERS